MPNAGHVPYFEVSILDAGPSRGFMVLSPYTNKASIPFGSLMESFERGGKMVSSQEIEMDRYFSLEFPKSE